MTNLATAISGTSSVTSVEPRDPQHQVRHSPVRCGSRQATAARSTEQERNEPSRPAERPGSRSSGADARTCGFPRAHGAGARPLARLPMGTIRSDQAHAEVGHGLACAAGQRRPARAAVPRPATHGDHRTCRDGRGGPRARVHKRSSVAPDGGALLAHPHRRETTGARCSGCRPALDSA